MRASRLIFVAALAFVSTALAETVTVRPGDSLWALAQRYGTSVDALMEANDLASPDLRPGDTLVLPGSQPSAPPPPAEWTVQPGDTLYEIALDAGVEVADLIAWNRLANTTIRPGDVLVLGPDEAVATPAAEAAPEPTTLSIEVGPGDTLWRIARLHDSSPVEIAAANGIAVDAVLHPGDLLVVPGAYVLAEDGPDQGGFAAPTISVDPGDTLWEISRRYGTTVEALMRANELSDALLRPGQELRIVGRDGAPLATTAAGERATTSQAALDAAHESVMTWPLQGPVTSHFGWRALRIGGSNMHYGLDIDGHTGDPIVAAAAGTVTYADWMGGFGKVVIVQQGDTEYLYAHASELLVRVGQQVEPGTLIARVGTTGRVTGSHLHFEIRVDGEAVDPAPVLQARAGPR